MELLFSGGGLCPSPSPSPRALAVQRWGWGQEGGRLSSSLGPSRLSMAPSPSLGPLLPGPEPHLRDVPSPSEGGIEPEKGRKQPGRMTLSLLSLLAFFFFFLKFSFEDLFLEC